MNGSSANSSGGSLLVVRGTRPCEPARKALRQGRRVRVSGPHLAGLCVGDLVSLGFEEARHACVLAGHRPPQRAGNLRDAQHALVVADRKQLALRGRRSRVER